MQNNYSDEQLHLAARLYYVDGMGQSEVAKFVRVSQAKVSRLLAMARERGIVRITVADYDPRDRDLEARLRVQLGLKTAIVIKMVGGLGNADLRKSIGLFAAPSIEEFIQTGSVIAVAGGRTIHALVHSLSEPRNKMLTVVQSMGSVDSSVSAFDAQEVGRVLAQRLGGSFVAMNTPAYVSEKKMRDALMKLDQVVAVHAQLNRANLALVGIGTLANSVFIERGVINTGAIEDLRTAGAVGEVCGRFYDANGNECNTGWRDLVMSVQLEQLRNIPNVIGVVSGTDRSASILGAVKGGFLKGLVIDEPGARALLADIPPAGRQPKIRKAKK